MIGSIISFSNSNCFCYAVSFWFSSVFCIEKWMHVWFESHLRRTVQTVHAPSLTKPRDYTGLIVLFSLSALLFIRWIACGVTGWSAPQCYSERVCAAVLCAAVHQERLQVHWANGQKVHLIYVHSYASWFTQVGHVIIGTTFSFLVCSF